MCCGSAGKRRAYSGRKSHHCLEFYVKPFIAAVLAIAMGALAGCAGTGSAGSGDRAASSSGSGVTVFGTIDAGVSGSSNRSERR